MTISRRLILLIAIPLVTLLGLAAFVIASLAVIEERTRLAAVTQSESLAVLGNISRAQAEMRVNLRSFLLSGDQTERDEAKAAFETDYLEAFQLLGTYADRLITTEEDRRLCGQYRALAEEWVRGARGVFAAASEGRTDEAVRRLDEVAVVGGRLSTVSREWIGHNEKLARDVGQSAVGRIERARRWVPAAGLAGLLLSALAGVWITGGIIRPLRRLRDTVESIARGDYSRPVPFTSARDETGDLARSISVLKDGAGAMEEQRWVKAGVAQLSESLRAASSIEEFGRHLLSTLVPLLGGGVGAFYLAEPEAATLRLTSSYGLASDPLPGPVEFGRGLAGQCAAGRRAVSVSGLPPDYLRISSGIGGAPPSRAGAWPLMAGQTLTGVFEHAAFHEPAPRQTALLAEALPVAAMSFEVLLRTVRTRELLEVTQKQASELGAQQATLRASEEQFRTLLEAAPDALIISAEDGRIVLVNAQAERLLGYGREELIGRPVEILVPERIRGRHPDLRRRYHESASVRPMGTDMELAAVRKDGVEFAVEISLSPLRSPTGERLVCSSLRDITDRKRAEVALRQAMKKAEEATVAKSAFLANMSHEIRTPMNGILGMTELALDTDLTAEQRDYLTTVKSSADALLSLINDILDFSKIEAGRIELDPVDFLLRDSLSDTLNPLALRASSKGVELAYDVARDVPDALIGDVYRLRQVVVNLVGNAIKFTERGEVVVSVALAERRGDEVTLDVVVRDTGIGIDPAAAARLFRPFEQAETSTTRKYGGTGLGLAISRQLVELMGGSIRLESEPGKGSTFSFSVTFKAGVERASGSADDAAHVFSGKTALIVDDNETNRRILTGMLGHWGLRSVAADSGSSALVLLDRTANAGQPVSIILTDLHMPEMDGFELIEKVRASASHGTLPVVLLTSSASPGDNARCAELRVSARLLKPVKQSLLLDNLMRVFAGAARSESLAPASPAGPAEPADGRRTLRVLLAEDNAVNQKFAVRVLSAAGHDVTVANNGREAVDRWSGGGFDVVLMDVQMPELDGLDATREIRGRESGSDRRVPIIAMTANAMKGDREMCLEAGMDGYVPKPVKRDVLFAEIDRVLKGEG